MALSALTYEEGVLRWHHILSGTATTAAVSAGLNPEIVQMKEWNDEVFSLYGIQVEYYPMVQSSSENIIYGEDTGKAWVSAVGGSVDFIFQPVDFSYEYGPWGAVSEEIIEAVGKISDFASMSYYNPLLSSSASSVEPKPGDLVVIVFEGSPFVYEVVDVKKDKPTMGTFNYFNYKFILKKWSYSGEDILSPDLSGYAPETSACSISAGEPLEIEDFSDDILDYDDYEDLNDDIYGGY